MNAEEILKLIGMTQEQIRTTASKYRQDAISTADKNELRYGKTGTESDLFTHNHNK